MAIKNEKWEIVSSRTKTKKRVVAEKTPAVALIKEGWFIEDKGRYDLYQCTLVEWQKTHSSKKAAYECLNRRTNEIYILYNVWHLLTKEKS